MRSTRSGAPKVNEARSRASRRRSRDDRPQSRPPGANLVSGLPAADKRSANGAPPSPPSKSKASPTSESSPRDTPAWRTMTNPFGFESMSIRTAPRWPHVGSRSPGAAAARTPPPTTANATATSTALASLIADVYPLGGNESARRNAAGVEDRLDVPQRRQQRTQRLDVADLDRVPVLRELILDGASVADDVGAVFGERPRDVLEEARAIPRVERELHAERRRRRRP